MKYNSYINNGSVMFISVGFVILLLLISLPAYSSGSFSPSGAGAGRAAYNTGKAIYSGRLGNNNCAECHKKFSRSKLLVLKSKKITPVDFALDCKSHTPCFKDKLNAKHQSALLAYFKKRYRM